MWPNPQETAVLEDSKNYSLLCEEMNNVNYFHLSPRVVAFIGVSTAMLLFSLK